MNMKNRRQYRLSENFQQQNVLFNIYKAMRGWYFGWLIFLMLFGAVILP